MISRNKIFVLFMALILVVEVLAGCGKNTPESNLQTDSQSAESETSIQADTKPDETVTEETSQAESALSEIADKEVESAGTEPAGTEAESTGVLVVYFSATGHTKPIAEYAAEYLNADIYEIVPEEAYTDADLNYNDASSRSSKEENDDSARPAIAGTLPDISDYDTIVIGHPIWWGKAPKIIYTFLESYDWTGKTLVTFCTSASSGLGSSADNLKPSASGNPNWLESRRFAIGAGEDEVSDWLEQILP